MPTLSPQTTPYYGGGQVTNPANVIKTSGAPSASAVHNGLGTLAVDNSTGTVYGLASLSGGTATWVVLGGGSGAVATITGNSGGAISPSGGNINLSGGTLANFVGSGSTLTITPKSGAYPISPYVVGPVGKAGYQTIQSAINAAVAAGGVSATVYVQPAIYTENLDFSATTALTNGITVVGAVGLGDSGQCEIIGQHTPPTTGALVMRNFKLSSSTNIFFSTAAGSSRIVIIDALLAVTNGYTFNCVNWNSSGVFELFDINNSGTNDGGVNNTGGASFFMFSAGLGNGNSNTMNLSGLSVIDNSNVGCAVNFGTGSNVVSTATNYSKTVTFSGNSTGSSIHDNYSTGAAACILMSSSAAVAVYQTVVNSSNNPCIDGAGAGTLSLADITFASNFAISGSLTLNWVATRSGPTSLSGNLVFTTAGNKIINTSVGTTTSAGANSIGTVTLVGGTATVSTTSVTSSSLIKIWRQSIGATGAAALGELTVGTITNATSFVINAALTASATSLATTDVSVVGWEIIN